MTTKCFKKIPTIGLREEEIKEILKKCSWARYNHAQGIIQVRNFDQARVVHKLANEYKRKRL